MASTLKLNEAQQIKTNITSSLDVSPSEHYFAAVTRRLSNHSSMFDYQLDLYDMQKMERLNSTPIYSSYDTQRHFCDFLADDSTIVVTTKYHIIFYDRTMKVKFKALHEQQNVYDLTSSPNGLLVAMVGDSKILLWNSVDYRTIKFEPRLAEARICRFNPDFTQMLATYSVQDTATIGIYDIIRDNGGFSFVLASEIKIDTAFGFISSVEYNPHKSTELVVGFSNTSPKLIDYSDPGSSFAPLYDKGEQPSYKDNYKIVAFLPDGKRVISSGYQPGVGLWPAVPSGDLVYKEDYFLFGLKPFDGGRKVIGFVWERIKIVEISFVCPKGTIENSEGNKKYLTACSCPSGQYWNSAMYECSNCLQGSVNICSCQGDEKFRGDIGVCIFNCTQVPHSVESQLVLVPLQNNAQCFCKPGYTWINGRCVFDCTKISNAISQNPNSNQSCICLFPLEWNNLMKICQCPIGSVYNQNANELCECDNAHYRTPEGQCNPDCTKQAVNADTLIDFSGKRECPCKPGMIFQRYEAPGSGVISEKCVQDCASQNETISGTPFSGCLCPENMKWSNQACVIDCSAITNAITEVVDPQTGRRSCTCPINYQWVPENYECGKNCSEVEFANNSKYSTALTCPCRETFAWDGNKNLCVIDCEQVNFTESYSVENTWSCVCRNNFEWDTKELQCMINCSNIWDAMPQRVSAGECKCNGDKEFNSTGMLCQEDSAASKVFSKPWVWAVLGVGIVFIIAVFIIMFRYCRKFSSERNKEHNKKLKKGPEENKRRKKNVKLKDAPSSTERMSLRKA